MEGEFLCASLGFSNSLQCGEVKAESTRWHSETGGFFVRGASVLGIEPDFGDSGSPVYRVHYVGGSWEYVPLGIVAHEPIDGRADMFFAKVKPALADWDAEIYP